MVAGSAGLTTTSVPGGMPGRIDPVSTTYGVAPASRGLGMGRRILQDVLHRARALGDVDQVLIAVTVGNAAAARLYADCGFVAYGREPRALKIDGVAYDIDHMILRL